MKNRKWFLSVTDYIVLIIGSVIYSAALEIFLIPSKISPGGVTGLASIVDYLYKVPTGFLTLIMNIPLFIIGIKKLGLRFIKRTVVATVLISIFIDVAGLFVPVYTGDRMLAAIYGGLLSGAGLALIMLRGGSSGGVDIIAKLTALKYPFFSIGRAILLLDMFVTAMAALAYNDIETALYTIVALFVSSKVIDAIIYGADKGKLVFIVTREPEAILKSIFENVRRGATVLKATGGWNKSDCDVIMCAVRIVEAGRLQKAVKQADPHAFMIMGEAGEIVGEGFKPI